MYLFRRAPLPQLALTVALDGGKRRSVQFEQNTFTFMLFAIIRYQLVISVATAGAILNGGSCAAGFDLIGVVEGGIDRVAYDPRVAVFLGQMRAMSPMAPVRLTTNVVGTYNLIECVPIYFTNPNSLNPGETAFREKNPTAFTNAFAQLSLTPATKIVTQGAATLASNNITVDFQQVHNQGLKRLPWYQTWVSQDTYVVAGAQAHLRIPLVSDRALAAVVLTQESSTTGSTVNDIINKVGLLSDVRQYIQPQEVYANLERQSELFFGGAVFAGSAFGTDISGPMLGLDFQHHGQLSTIIDPNETNLRLDLDVSLSASGGSTIRVTKLELVRDLNVYNGPDGLPRRVCNPDTPPWIAARLAS